MGFFDFKQIELLTNLLPPDNREEALVQLGYALTKPFEDLALRDTDYFNQELLRAKYVPSKGGMQKILNEELGLPANTIVVVTVDNSGGTFAGNEGELPVLYAGNLIEGTPTFAGNLSESPTPLGYDFKVQLPNANNTTDNQNLISHLVDRMKLAGKSYIIEIV